DGDTILSSFVDSNNYYRNPRYKIETIDYLITKGADVNVKDKKGRSILLKATYNNNQEVIELLKKYGAKY
ncbi:MAG: ankyrin repeat domain-containing protein, partial [Cyanobacteria bacterium J06638_38]